MPIEYVPGGRDSKHDAGGGLHRGTFAVGAFDVDEGLHREGHLGDA